MTNITLGYLREGVLVRVGLTRMFSFEIRHEAGKWPKKGLRESFTYEKNNRWQIFVISCTYLSIFTEPEAR